MIGAIAISTVVGCRSRESLPEVGPVALRVGYSVIAGGSLQAGVRQIVRNQSLEGLVNTSTDGRPFLWLAESVWQSDDRLTSRITLAPAMFHDASPVTATMVRQILLAGLPAMLGPASEDIREITVPSEREIEFKLNRPSAFLLEGLDVPIERPGHAGVGTGPYRTSTSSGDETVLLGNASYRHGAPAIERIVLKPYNSVRAAWADLLRGQVDALYEVGVDALDSLRPSQQVKVFSYRRHYAQMVVLNLARPVFRDRHLRRRLNGAIDRERLVQTILAGNGAAASGPVWPDHWAHGAALTGFTYRPEAVPAGQVRIGFTCLLVDPTQEGLALAVQRQLQAIGVEMTLESLPQRETLTRLQSGNFDAVLGDFVQGPNLVRPYLFWHSDGPFNYGHYRSSAVDSALDSIRHAVNDEAYKAGVTAFQRAIVADPPAIFLAWSERARAVSSRFDVAVDRGPDVWTTLRLWRPSADHQFSSRN